MWRDELQAWLIARDSSSVRDLFKNLRYEGHPGLWHICLYVITRFTTNPIAMQFFHLAIATGVVYVFARFSPFSRRQKFLFAFGYFPFYEYSIISRNYSLGVLLIFIFCARFSRRHQSYILLATVLSLLANTNVYGFIIALCMALTLGFERIVERDRFLAATKGNLIASLTVFISGAVMALIQLIPPADAPFKGQTITLTESDVLLISKTRLLATLTTIWRSYVPIPNFFRYNFWNTNFLLIGVTALSILAVLFSLWFFFFVAASFMAKPPVLFLYLSGTCGILLFTYAKYLGGARHHGHLFILFLACAWVSCFYERRSNWEIEKKIIKFPGRERFLTIILSAHVLAGAFAFSMDFIYPFSGSLSVAKFINSRGLAEAIIVGTKDDVSLPISAFISRDIYYPESDRFGSFIVWRDRKKVNLQETLAKIDRLASNTSKNVLLILSEEYKDIDPKIKGLEIFISPTSIAKENYKLYLFRKGVAGSQP